MYNFLFSNEIISIQARPILIDGKVSRLLDPTLGGNYNQDEMERVVLAASLCIRRAPRARPPMSLVSSDSINYTKFLSKSKVTSEKWVISSFSFLKTDKFTPGCSISGFETSPR